MELSGFPVSPIATSEPTIRGLVAAVEDPELPVRLSDLGVLRSVAFDGERVIVRLRATRIGCPGRHEMARRVRAAVTSVDPDRVTEIVWDNEQWSLDDVSPRGRAALAEFGHVSQAGRDMHCPYCDSVNVERVSEFGGTLCSRPFMCRGCGSPFAALVSLEGELSKDGEQ